MSHGIVDVAAYQEALLIEAAFGVALLTMIWVAFRRWLQHKERMGKLIASQTAERGAQFGDQLQSVEERLKSIEQTLAGGRGQAAPQIEAAATMSPPNEVSEAGEIPRGG